MPLSETTGIHPETIRMFMSGHMAVPAGVLDKVDDLVRRRVDELVGIAEKIEKVRRGQK
jgi:hypothetical protein